MCWSARGIARANRFSGNPRNNVSPASMGAPDWRLQCGALWKSLGKSGARCGYPLMFLGEFEHAIDDKGRLAIPAKFRAELTGGLVVTRGLDRCLFVWPMEEWRGIAQKLGQLSLMNAD